MRLYPKQPDVDRGAQGSFSSLNNLKWLHLEGGKEGKEKEGRERRKGVGNPIRNWHSG